MDLITIGLDYGHGRDTFPPSKGVYKGGKGYHEHDFNSALGLKIKAKLEALGYKVVEAQPAYQNEVSLHKRTDLYNYEEVDIVISLHANANADDEVHGRCAFYWHTSEESKRLASLIIAAIKEAGYNTHGNGLHASKPNSWTNLAICRETNMPAVLVENGFMSNDRPGTDDDFELIFGSKQDEYTDDLADAYISAIVDYFGGSKKPEKKESKPKPKPVKKKEVTGTTAYIQKTVNDRYGFGIAVDNIFGYETKKALIKAYQTELNRQFNAGLVVDGVFGRKTKAASVTIEKGARGNLTWVLQAILFCKRYDPQGIEGVFGRLTKSAVKGFQRANDLIVDGLAGPNTFEALFD